MLYSTPCPMVKKKIREAVENSGEAYFGTFLRFLLVG